MTPKALAQIKRELFQMRKSPQGRKARDLVSIAQRVGRIRDNRGKEPTYVRAVNPALSPPLSIPDHGARDLKTGTAKNIIDMLLDDVSEWEIFLNQAQGDGDGDN